MTRAIDLNPADLALVVGILGDHLPPVTQLCVFGSRSTGTARRYSDLDLALEAAEPLALHVIGRIADALSPSDLPYKVDLLDLGRTAPAFRDLIEDDFLPLA